MKNTLNAFGLVMSLFMFSACNYSNSFQGTFNNSPATLNAYTKNLGRVCIALNFTSPGLAVPTAYINSNSVFDENDPFKAKTFNTKGQDCNANMNVYLAGSHSVTVLGTGEAYGIFRISPTMCQYLYFKRYYFQEQLQFDMKDITTDQVTGSFSGTGQPDSYIDDSHPTHYGAIFFCGSSGGTFPPR